VRLQCSSGMNIITACSRELLKRTLEEIRAYRKSNGDRFAFKLTDAWVYKVGADHWEFHFGKFYWRGSATTGMRRGLRAGPPG